MSPCTAFMNLFLFYPAQAEIPVPVCGSDSGRGWEKGCQACAWSLPAGTPVGSGYEDPTVSEEMPTWCIFFWGMWLCPHYNQAASQVKIHSSPNAAVGLPRESGKGKGQAVLLTLPPLLGLEACMGNATGSNNSNRATGLRLSWALRNT